MAQSRAVGLDKQPRWTSSPELSMNKYNVRWIISPDQAGYAYLVQKDANSSIIQLETWAEFQEVRTIKMQSFFVTDYSTFIAVDGVTKDLYVLGRSHLTNSTMPAWCILRINSWTGIVQQKRFLRQLDFSDTPLSMFLDDKGRIYVIAGEPLPGFQPFRTKILRYDSARSPELRNATTPPMSYVDDITLTMKEYSGHFWTNNHLFVTTKGGELVRIAYEHQLESTGVMTIVTGDHDIKKFDPKFMPSLGPAHVIDEKRVLLTAQNGHIIFVDIPGETDDHMGISYDIGFCRDGEICPMNQGSWTLPPLFTFVLIGGVIFLMAGIAVSGFVAWICHWRKEDDWESERLLERRTSRYT